MKGTANTVPFLICIHPQRMFNTNYMYLKILS